MATPCASESTVVSRATAELGQGDMRAMLQLTGELADLHDSAVELRCAHLLAGINRMVAPCASVIALLSRQAHGSGQAWEAVRAIAQGWSEDQRDAVRTYFTDRLYCESPFECPAFLQASTADRVYRRIEIVDDEQWYAHPHVNGFRRISNVDDAMVCVSRQSRKQTLVIGLNRPWGACGFDPHDRNLVEVLNESLGWFYRGVAQELGVASQSPSVWLTGERDPRPNGLSPRQRETLDHLLRGLPDKQIAAEMDLSVSTVRQYVRGIFRELSVKSRSELLARWIDSR